MRIRTTPVYSLDEIRKRLLAEDLPLTGVTEEGSAEFIFAEPAGYLGVAMHSASRTRPAVEEALAVGPQDRFREEDPYTDQFISSFPVQVVARDSRYEYDLNREEERCIYPADRPKWGEMVWRYPLPPREMAYSRRKFREFHALLDLAVEFALRYRKEAILFDMHAFCYRREKNIRWWKDDKPEINLGTRSILREYFNPVVERFLEGVSGMELEGKSVRVEENTAFPGGYLTRKYARIYPERLLVLAIEYKKIFMDERTGELFPDILDMLIGNFLLTKEALLKAGI